jgi:class 3 adenylate cyclase/alpha-beta hydrolase superfamily lysophospholipase
VSGEDAPVSTGIPQTRYAVTTDDAYIAYQELGEGEPLLIIHPYLTHLDVMWEWAGYAKVMRSLAATARVTTFDKRGMGLSDRITRHVDLDDRLDDIRAVLDAADIERCSLFGWGEGAALAIMFAATYPARTTSMALFVPQVRTAWSEDYPWGATAEDEEEYQRSIPASWAMEDPTADVIEANTGDVSGLANDPAFRAVYQKLARYSTAPAGAIAYSQVWFETDVRQALPAVSCPTLVLGATEDTVRTSVAESAYVADRIEGSVFATIAGRDFGPMQRGSDELIDRVRSFLGLPAPRSRTDRVLATVLFTDIVGSTETATAMGDEAWRALITDHERRSRAILDRYRGVFDHTTGDGLMARFDGPARAVQCGQDLVEMSRGLGVEIRAGAHTGEVELTSGGAHGVAVHVAARVAAKAGASEVWASSTVKDLTAGSGLAFEDAGEHELKGVPDRWRLYRVVGA